ncbi:hypothetical protein MRS44_013619 [Fusarium solani]|uniref:uncharacterized protein n=1 Tax=Fusarium solani TaxID=169388 RepID=UPI0032C3F590|nr:hypothetical protein MRS44_013619 [Fusarium solani]
MTLLRNISPPLIQEALSQQISILDLFLPALTNITGAASQVLSAESLEIFSTLKRDAGTLNIPCPTNKGISYMAPLEPEVELQLVDCRCVVLLGNIDAAGATCFRDSGPENSDSDTDSKSRRRGVTLSGLCLDMEGILQRMSTGWARQRGRETGERIRYNDADVQI